jgi:membrane-associated phospholipid phosphatase
MRQFIFSLPRNVINCFKNRLILWHILAVVLTVILVTSGFDGWYFKNLNTPEIRQWMMPAAGIGFLGPFCLPPFLLLCGYLLQDARYRTAGYALAQAVIVGWLISSTYKAFTGREHPHRNGVEDLSQKFHFGFLRGGVFWGWPSSHTTIAFAMAVTVCALYPKRRRLGAIAIAYALYIGIGISTTIHWFSDFVAGAIIGSVIGTVVGKSFLPFKAKK